MMLAYTLVPELTSASVLSSNLRCVRRLVWANGGQRLRNRVQLYPLTRNEGLETHPMLRGRTA